MKEELISDYAEIKPQIEKRDTGNREKAMRVARGLEIDEIAKCLKITANQLSKIEDDGEFSDEHLHMLAKFYGVSYQFMRGGINDSYIEEGLL